VLEQFFRPPYDAVASSEVTSYIDLCLVTQSTTPLRRVLYRLDSAANMHYGGILLVKSAASPASFVKPFVLH
jgi:hypothetical protein